MSSSLNTSQILLSEEVILYKSPGKLHIDELLSSFRVRDQDRGV